MKSYLIIFLFIILGCENAKNSETSLPTIKYSDVQNVEIRKDLSDTLSVDLNRFHIARVVTIVNSSEKVEVLKAIPKYWVFMKLKNDSVVIYKVIDSKIGHNDLYIEVEDKDYFKVLYEKNRKSKNRITN